MQCGAVRCDAMQCSAVRCGAVQLVNRHVSSQSIAPGYVCQFGHSGIYLLCTCVRFIGAQIGSYPFRSTSRLCSKARVSGRRAAYLACCAASAECAPHPATARCIRCEGHPKPSAPFALAGAGSDGHCAYNTLSLGEMKPSWTTASRLTWAMSRAA